MCRSKEEGGHRCKNVREGFVVEPLSEKEKETLPPEQLKEAEKNLRSFRTAQRHEQKAQQAAEARQWKMEAKKAAQEERIRMRPLKEASRVATRNALRVTTVKFPRTDVSLPVTIARDTGAEDLKKALLAKPKVNRSKSDDEVLEESNHEAEVARDRQLAQRQVEALPNQAGVKNAGGRYGISKEKMSSRKTPLTQEQVAQAWSEALTWGQNLSRYGAVQVQGQDVRANTPFMSEQQRLERTVWLTRVDESQRRKHASLYAEAETNAVEYRETVRVYEASKARVAELEEELEALNALEQNEDGTFGKDSLSKEDVELEMLETRTELNAIKERIPTLRTDVKVLGRKQEAWGKQKQDAAENMLRLVQEAAHQAGMLSGKKTVFGVALLGYMNIKTVSKLRAIEIADEALKEAKIRTDARADIKAPKA